MSEVKVLLPDGFENLIIDGDVIPFLLNPDALLQVSPYKRGAARGKCHQGKIRNNNTVQAKLPTVEYTTVSQEELVAEFEPEAHRVKYDTNIPSIVMKTQDGGFIEVDHVKMALPYQKRIHQKDLIHTCGNKTEHNLLIHDATKRMEKDYVLIKEEWSNTVQDSKRDAFVDSVLRLGVAGWLFYLNRKNEIDSRVLEYPDYTICPHYDRNGDALINSVYYKDKSTGKERIDSYDDKYIYSHIREDDSSKGHDWSLVINEHGFNENPLLVVSSPVSWDDAQSLIEVYEIMFNIFTVIMKRHGWGILYIRGRVDKRVEKIAGSVILQDTSLDGNGSAEFKTPPNPEGMFNMLEALFDEIQVAASCTFLSPKDINMSGDISGIAIQLTQGADIEKAINNIAKLQKTINAATRLFTHGLAKQLVLKQIKPNAITEFAKLKIGAKMTPWMPKSQAELVQTITTLKGANLLSQETGVEVVQGLGIGKPSEKFRIADDESREAGLKEKEKTEIIKVEDINHTQE